MRSPVRREPITPPGFGELAELPYADRRSRTPACQPPCYMLFRPEEVHRASGEDDVVPPLRSRHQTVEDQFRHVRTLIADEDGHGFAAVPAGGFDPSIRGEGGTDAERIPGTVGIPPAAACMHAVGRRNGGKWVCHADLAGFGIQHQRMLVMQGAPTGPDLLNGQAATLRDLGCPRGAAQFDEERIGQCPKTKERRFHERHFVTENGAASSPLAGRANSATVR